MESCESQVGEDKEEDNEGKNDEEEDNTKQKHVEENVSCSKANKAKKSGILGMPFQRSVAFDLSEDEESKSNFEQKNDHKEKQMNGIEAQHKKKDSTTLKKEIIGILKPPNPKKDLKSFPSLPECFLHDLGLIEKGSLSTEHLSEQDIELKFTSLSLAFKTDRVTLQERMELQLRQRDIAERNVEDEIRQLKTSIRTLNRMCQDSETREVLERVSKQVTVLQQSSGRVSSSAEVYGAVQQEARVATAIEIMLLHVDNLKRLYEKEHHELEETKLILVKHKLLVDDSGLSLVEDKRDVNPGRNRSVSVMHNSSCHGQESPKLRRASVATTVHKHLTVTSPEQNKTPTVSQKVSVRKIGISSTTSRKTSTDESVRNIINEPIGSHFTPIQEHVEDGKDEDSRELVSEDTNNNAHVKRLSVISKRESRKVSNLFCKEVDENTILEEIDMLAKKRDSSPAPTVKSLPKTAEEYLQRKRSMMLHLKEWYDDLYWPYDQEETVLGVRYCITGLLLTAAAMVMLVTFLGTKHGHNL